MKNLGAACFNILTIILLFISLSACGGGGGGSPDLVEEPALPGQGGSGDSDNYFPFTIGNTWQYKGVSTATGSSPVTYSSTVTVSGTQIINGFSATVFRESISGDEAIKGEYFLAKEENGIFDPGSGYTSDFPNLQLLPFKEVRFPLKPGESFVQINRKGLDIGEDLDGDAKNETIDIISTITVRDFESVSVPYGTFSDCAVLEREVKITMTFSYSKVRESIDVTERAWLARNIGWVKRASTLEFDGFTGTDTEELVGFVHVSSLASTPAPQGLTGYGEDLFWSDNSATPVKKVSTAGGEPVPLAEKMVGVPQKFVVQGGDVFWSNDATLYKRSLLGGVTSEVAVRKSPFGTLGAIAADSESIYWVDSADNTSTIMKAPLSGGAPVTLVSSDKGITALALSDTHLYWQEEGIGPITLPNGPEGSAIRRISKGGGLPDTIVDGALNGLITPLPEPYLPGSWFPRGGLVVDGDDLFFGDTDFFDSYRVMKVSVTGGPITILTEVIVETADQPRALTVDTERVYWVDGKALYKTARSGGAFEILSPTENVPQDLVFASDNLYWSEATGPAHGETGRIKAIAASGGAVTTLYQGGDAPRDLIIIDGIIYWNEGGDIGGIEGFGRIASMLQNGGSVTAVVDGIWTANPEIAVGDDSIFIADGWRVKKVSTDGGKIEILVTGNETIKTITYGDGYLYWIERTGGLYRSAVTGGDIKYLAATPPFAEAGLIRIGGGFVFWFENGSTIKKVPITGGTPTVVTAANVSDFVTDGLHLYLAQVDGKISRLSLNGGQILTVLQTNYSSNGQLALDGDYLYWIDNLDVGRIAKNGSDTPVFYRVTMFGEKPGSLWIDDSKLYWTEPDSNVIKRAVPY